MTVVGYATESPRFPPPPAPPAHPPPPFPEIYPLFVRVMTLPVGNKSIVKAGAPDTTTPVPIVTLASTTGKNVWFHPEAITAFLRLYPVVFVEIVALNTCLE
jgi:hypothetical protein